MTPDELRAASDTIGESLDGNATYHVRTHVEQLQALLRQA